MTSTFARPVIGTFAAYLAGLAANLVVSILVARILGPAGAGLIALALVGPNILALLGNLGLPSAVSHFLQKRTFASRRIVGPVASINFTLGVLLAVGYVAALPLLENQFGVRLPPALALIAAAIIPLEIALQDLMAVCQGYQSFARRSAILLGCRWLYAALAAAALFFWQTTPEAVVTAGCLAYLLALVVGVILVRGLLKHEPTEPQEPESPSSRAPRGGSPILLALAAALAVWFWRGDLLASAVTMFLVLIFGRIAGNYLRSRASGQSWSATFGPEVALLGYAWRVHVAAVLLFLILRADLFLVSRLLGDAAEVGLYSRAGQVAEIIFYFMLAAENVLFPHLSSLPPAEVARAAAMLCRRGLLVGLALAVVFELTATWLITIPFGPDFVGAIAPLRILLPGVLAIGFARMLFSVFNALERPWPPAIVAAVGLTVMLALDFAWIPRWGISGAALASLVAYGLVAAVLLVWFTLASRGISGAGPRVGLTDFFVPRRQDFASLWTLLSGTCGSAGLSRRGREDER